MPNTPEEFRGATTRQNGGEKVAAASELQVGAVSIKLAIGRAAFPVKISEIKARATHSGRYCAKITACNIVLYGVVICF